MTASAPLVSIVIPTRNRQGLLREAVQSVLDQTWRNLELIIVDDGSTDATPEVVSALGARVRSVRTSGVGVAAARNLGLAAARGELIGFLDDDDIFFSEKIAAQVALLNSQPQAVSAHCRYHFMHESGAIMHHCGVLPAGSVSRQLIRSNFIWSGAPLIRRAPLLSEGGFDERLSAAADFDLWLRLSRRGSFVCSQRLLGAYRLTAGSMATRMQDMEADCMRTLDAYFAGEQAGRAMSALRSDAEARWRLWFACGYLDQRRDQDASRNIGLAFARAPRLLKKHGELADLLSNLILDARYADPVKTASEFFAAAESVLPMRASLIAEVKFRALIAVAMRKYAAGSYDEGRADLEQCLRCVDSRSNLRQLMSKMLFESAMCAWIGPERFLSEVAAHWPQSACSPDEIMRMANADVTVWQGVENYMTGSTAAAFSQLLSGLAQRPNWLRNRGVLAVFARSVLAAARESRDYSRTSRSLPSVLKPPSAHVAMSSREGPRE